MGGEGGRDVHSSKNKIKKYIKNHLLMKTSGATDFALLLLQLCSAHIFNWVNFIYSKSTLSATLHRIDKEYEKVSFKVILTALWRPQQAVAGTRIVDVISGSGASTEGHPAKTLNLLVALGTLVIFPFLLIFIYVCTGKNKFSGKSEA